MNEQRARELWFEEPRRTALREGTEPAMRPGSVKVRALASAISQGTELLLYRGEGPTPFDVSLGTSSCTTYPCRYGYCWVGEVTQCASDVTTIEVGTRVFALAAHGDVHVLHEHDANVIGFDIPPIRATLAANLETAVNGIWDARVSLGDRVTVFGAGVVGLLVAWLASKSGADVTLVEIEESRRRLAAEFAGVRTLAPSQLASEPGSDVVIEATGNPATLDDAVRCAGHEATIIVLSFYGERSHPVRLGEQFHRRRLSLKSSQVSVLPPHQVPRWSHARRFELVRRLLREPMLDALVDHRVSFDDAPETYARLDRNPSQFRQTVFVYGGSCTL